MRELMTSEPAASSWAANRLDIFSRGENNALIHKWFDGDHGWLPDGKEGDWEPLGAPRTGPLTSGPAVASDGQGRLWVLARGAGNVLWSRYFPRSGGNQWSGWAEFGHEREITSRPAAVSWGPNRTDVFARAMDHTLIHKWWDGDHGILPEDDWEPLGAPRTGPLTSGPAVASDGQGRLWVLARGAGNVLWERWFPRFSTNTWSAWGEFSQERPVDPGPAAVSWGPNRIDVFARAMDHTLIHKWWDGDHGILPVEGWEQL
jgi:hypothetical protein